MGCCSLGLILVVVLVIVVLVVVLLVIVVVVTSRAISPFPVHVEDACAKASEVCEETLGHVQSPEGAAGALDVMSEAAEKIKTGKNLTSSLTVATALLPSYVILTFLPH